MALPRGSFPTMITPFLPGGEIDWITTDRLIEWYIASGCVGIFTVCLSSEMYHLTPEERIEMAKHVQEKVAGRVCVVASGTFGGSIESQAEFCLKISAYCNAVVVLTCQLATKEESDEIWLQNAQKLLDLTSNIPLGLYECPDPYKRVLSPEVLKWAAQSKRFFFHKDTCCSSTQIKKKIEAVNIPDSPFRFYNANIATLDISCNDGGDGFSGISANFYPYIHSYMLKLIFSENYNSNDEAKKKVTKIQRFLSIAECVVAENYPGSAKLYLAAYGEKDGHMIAPTCRKAKYTWEEEQLIRIKELFHLQRDTCESLGITEIKF